MLVAFAKMMEHVEFCIMIVWLSSQNYLIVPAQGTPYFSPCCIRPWNYIRYIINFVEYNMIINGTNSGRYYYWVFSILLGTLGIDRHRLSHLFSTITSSFSDEETVERNVFYFSKSQLGLCLSLHCHFIAQSICLVGTNQTKPFSVLWKGDRG